MFASAPRKMAHAPSTAAELLKAQQLPHGPWSLTSVTFPADCQSITVGFCVRGEMRGCDGRAVLAGQWRGRRGRGDERNMAENSSLVRSAKGVIPSR